MSNNSRFQRQERILAAVQENTLAMLQRPESEAEWLHAGTIAQLLGMDRANVARELNRLYNDGQLIKLHGRPTYYLCRSALSQRFPDVFFPSAIPKGGHLSDYTAAANSDLPGKREVISSSLESQPGAAGTLRSAVLYAKGAMAYPTKGLHTLIYGNVGTGKELFARRMYEYAVGSSRLPSEAPFVVVNCRGYGSSPQLLLNQLFGYSRSAVSKGEKSHRGLIEKAAGGVLCLNGVEQLPTAVQDALIAVLEKNTYTRIGEASAIRYASAIIIATSTEPPDAPSMATFQQRFPIHIRIPDLDRWSLRELAEILIQSFRQEASSAGLSFRLSRESFSCFLQASYPGNLSELFKAVRTACALAFLDHSSDVPRPKTIEIRPDHLSAEFLRNIQASPEREQAVQQLLSLLSLEYIDFTPLGFLSNRFTPHQLMELLHRGKSEETREAAAPAPLAAAVELTRPYFSRRIIRGDPLPRELVATIQRILKAYPSPIPDEAAFPENNRLFACLADGVRGRLPELPVNTPPGLLAELAGACPGEAAAANVLRSAVEAAGASFSDKEMVYLITCLALTGACSDWEPIPILLVLHGRQVASDTADFVNQALNCSLAAGVNYRPGMSFESLLEEVRSTAKAIDRGSGILIAVDMDPLCSLREHILRSCGISCELVAGVSLPLLLSIGHLALRHGVGLHSLTDQALSVVAGSAPQPESSFINRTVNELLAPSLTFLNPQKAIEVLRTTLDRFLKESGIMPSSEIIVKFVFHCSHMLERLIRGTPLKYDGLKSFVNQHGPLMARLEAQMRYPAEIFGVSIPVSELAYIAEILLPYLG